MKKYICCLALMMGCFVSTKDAVPEADFDAVTEAAHDGIGAFRGDFDVCDQGTPGTLDEHTPYHFWAFDSDGCDDTFIDVASRDGDDLYMLLYRRAGSSWRVMHRNDDCRGSLNSCYEGGLAAGSYLVAVTTYEYMRYRTPTDATYEVNVHCDGDASCGTLGIGCGGFRHVDDVVVCDDGQFCDIPTGCGWADESGHCTLRPEICPAVFTPVCGCNDHTYGNACEAASAGVSVLTEGVCGTLGQSCGSRGMAPCEDGQFCNFPVAAICGATDLPGVCEETPTSCSFRRVWIPVCGCDGRNYDDACLASQHGISVASEGACEAEAISCGDDSDCIASERCIGRPEGFPYGKCRNVTTHPGYQASCFADSDCNAHLVCIAHDNTGRGYCAENWMREEFESSDHAVIPPIVMGPPLSVPYRRIRTSHSARRHHDRYRHESHGPKQPVDRAETTHRPIRRHLVGRIHDGGAISQPFCGPLRLPRRFGQRRISASGSEQVWPRNRRSTRVPNGSLVSLGLSYPL